MNKIDVYSLAGTKKEGIALPKEFDGKVNDQLIAQAVRVYDDREHLGLARAKTRAEIRISTRKIYRQKGTGGARHGAKSAPIFVGGGVTHGPKGIKRILSLPKAMVKLSLASVLALKVKEGKVIVIDGFSSLKKTNEAYKLLTKLFPPKEKAGKVSFVLAEGNLGARRALRNLKGVTIYNYKNLNAKDVFLGGTFLFDRDIFTAIPKTKKAVKVEKKTK